MLASVGSRRPLVGEEFMGLESNRGRGEITEECVALVLENREERGKCRRTTDTMFL